MTNLFSKEFLEKVRDALTPNDPQTPVFLVIASKDDFPQIEKDAWEYYGQFSDNLRVTPYAPGNKPKDGSMRFMLWSPKCTMLVLPRDGQYAPPTPCSLT